MHFLRFNNANLEAELLEIGLAKCLRQYVFLPILPALFEEMIASIYVFTPIVENRAFDERYGGLVVHL